MYMARCRVQLARHLCLFKSLEVPDFCQLTMYKTQQHGNMDNYKSG